MADSVIALIIRSPLIRRGFDSIARSIGGVVVRCADGTAASITSVNPDVVVVEASDLRAIAVVREYTKARILPIVTAIAAPGELDDFEEVVALYDSEYDVLKKLRRMLYREAGTYGNVRKNDELSPREKDVVLGIVKGLSNKEIATDINVSVNTVMTHRRNIASKLQIHSPAGLTIYAITTGLVDIHEIKNSDYI